MFLSLMLLNTRSPKSLQISYPTLSRPPRLDVIVTGWGDLPIHASHWMHLDLSDFQRSEVLKRLYRLPLDFLEVCLVIGPIWKGGLAALFFQFGMMNWMYNYRFVFLEELSLPPPQTYQNMFGFKRSGWRMLFLLEGLTALILGPFANGVVFLPSQLR